MRERQAAAETRNQADTTREELSAALTSAGVTLPSLRVDLASWTQDEPRPLIDLGRCNIAMARQLAAALRAGNGKAGAEQ